MNADIHECTLVLYKLNINFPIFHSHHRHPPNIMICLVQHKETIIELKCSILSLSLWLQIPHHVKNITNVSHQVVEHLRLEWSCLFNGSTYIAYKSITVTMIEVTRLHTNEPPPWVNLALLLAWTTHKLIPKQCHNHTIAYNCSLQLHS
jgi:hypothetical protein